MRETASVQPAKKMLMLLHAANRNPRKWENPDSYDISRRTAGHVAYGTGIHVCVGMLVARMEGKVVLGAMARRIAPRVRVGAPVRWQNNTLRALGSLPRRATAG